MAEIALDRASVVAVVASLKPVSVAQHVGTDEKDAQWGILAIAGLCSGRARLRSYVHPPASRRAHAVVVTCGVSEGWHGFAEAAVAVNADISNTSE